MPMILDQIVAYKREFLADAQRRRTLSDVKARMADAPPALDFRTAITRGNDLRVIAEVKKASPSKGIIREDFEPVSIAASYAEHGAGAISVLTDEQFFKGHLNYLREVRKHVSHVPLLRKDFTIDEYQVYEAREAGASAVLLIASILDRHQLVGLRELAENLGMAALTEVHSEKEADLVAELGATLIGVNNRDLRDFKVDLHQTERVLQLMGAPIPGYTFVAESGISKPEDVDYLRTIPVDAILVGESFMREKNPGDGIDRLMSR